MPRGLRRLFPGEAGGTPLCSTSGSGWKARKSGWSPPGSWWLWFHLASADDGLVETREASFLAPTHLIHTVFPTSLVESTVHLVLRRGLDGRARRVDFPQHAGLPNLSAKTETLLKTTHSMLLYSQLRGGGNEGQDCTHSKYTIDDFWSVSIAMTHQHEYDKNPSITPSSALVPLGNQSTLLSPLYPATTNLLFVPVG